MAFFIVEYRAFILLADLFANLFILTFNGVIFNSSWRSLDLFLSESLRFLTNRSALFWIFCIFDLLPLPILVNCEMGNSRSGRTRVLIKINLTLGGAEENLYNLFKLTLAFEISLLTCRDLNLDLLRLYPNIFVDGFIVSFVLLSLTPLIFSRLAVDMPKGVMHVLETLHSNFHFFFPFSCFL